MADRYQPKPFICEGGLIENLGTLMQASAFPGSAITLQNFEPGLEGGYRRISGYQKFAEDAPTGTGAVLGSFVFYNGVVACRKDSSTNTTLVYHGAGGPWTQVNSSVTFSGSNKVRGTTYNLVSPTLVLVNSEAKPMKYRPADGTPFKELSNAPEGASCVVEFRQHLFLGVGTNLVHSAPGDDENWNGIDGAGSINVGHNIIALAAFRDELYIFSRKTIYKLSGNSSLNFELIPVTQDIGCQAADSVWEVGGSLLFLGPDGIRPLGATSRIGDVEIESISRAVQSRVTNLMSTYGADGICAVIVREKSQYRLFGSEGGTDTANAEGVLGGIRTNSQGMTGFEWSLLRGIKPYCTDSAYINDEEFVVFGGYDGYVYRMERGNSFDGEPVVAIYTTPHITFDDPTLRKTLYKIDAYVDVEGSGQADVTLNVQFDQGDEDVLQPADLTIVQSPLADAYWDDGLHTWGDGSRWAQKQKALHKDNLEGSCFTASFTFKSEDILPPWTIKSFIVQFIMNGRR